MIDRSATAVRPLPDELADRIDLAAPVCADNGLDATRIDDLAKATGIPRATLYEEIKRIRTIFALHGLDDYLQP